MNGNTFDIMRHNTTSICFLLLFIYDRYIIQMFLFFSWEVDRV